jgi:hypothetical protein
MNAMRKIRFVRPFAGIVLVAACHRDEPPRPAPDLMAVEIDTSGHHGNPRWVDMSRTNLKPGPVRPEPLTAVQRARVETVQKALSEVDGNPLSEWLDDFSRDGHPDAEIATYEAIADAFTRYCGKHETTLAMRKDVYRVLLERSTASSDEVVAHTRLRELSHQQLVDVLAEYKAPPSPIVVSPP